MSWGALLDPASLSVSRNAVADARKRVPVEGHVFGSSHVYEYSSCLTSSDHHIVPHITQLANWMSLLIVLCVNSGTTLYGH